MSWYIGQRIVAIADHPDDKFCKGDEFEIKALSKCGCNCKLIIIDIGMTAIGKPWGCRSCDMILGGIGTNIFYRETWFAPIDLNQELSDYTAEELIDILEPKKINA